jgi:hypothetical protein
MIFELKYTYDPQGNIFSDISHNYHHLLNNIPNADIFLNSDRRKVFSECGYIWMSDNKYTRDDFKRVAGIVKWSCLLIDMDNEIVDMSDKLKYELILKVDMRYEIEPNHTFLMRHIKKVQRFLKMEKLLKGEYDYFYQYKQFDHIETVDES